MYLLQKYNISIRFITLALTLLLVLAPLTGWWLVEFYTNQPARVITKEDAEKVINSYLSSNEDEVVKVNNVKVISIKKSRDDWYLVTTESRGLRYRSVLSNFNGLQVVVAPGDILSKYNISLIGIPYEIMDELVKVGDV